jgi:hypothetical protein
MYFAFWVETGLTVNLFMDAASMLESKKVGPGNFFLQMTLQFREM